MHFWEGNSCCLKNNLNTLSLLFFLSIMYHYTKKYTKHYFMFRCVSSTQRRTTSTFEVTWKEWRFACHLVCGSPISGYLGAITADFPLCRTIKDDFIYFILCCKCGSVGNSQPWPSESMWSLYSQFTAHSGGLSYLEKGGMVLLGWGLSLPQAN